MNLVSILYNWLASNAWLAKLKELVYDKSCKHETLANELQKRITRKPIKRKIALTLMGKIWGVDLANMQLISKWNKGVQFLL